MSAVPADPSRPQAAHPPPPLAFLRELHAEIDRLADAIVGAEPTRFHCRHGCSGCCQDELTVFGIEAENIRAHHRTLIEEGIPHQHGACAFLDEAGACRIYAERPYVCRTQGLPLRWVEEQGDGSVVELRDLCDLNDGGTPLEEIPGNHCWTLGPAEEALAMIEERWSEGAAGRVSLRSLFSRPAPDFSPHGFEV